MGSPLTTHVLDTARGVPAEGVAISLAEERQGSWLERGQFTTNADGRVGAMLDAGALHTGRWRLRFDVAAYFERHGLPCFFPYAELVFDVTDLARHHHVPLLVSPFGFSTYRGS